MEKKIKSGYRSCRRERVVDENMKIEERTLGKIKQGSNEESNESKVIGKRG
ncbi:hypothetical protein YC2023_019844 [Brassica napus]